MSGTQVTPPPGTRTPRIRDAVSGNATALSTLRTSRRTISLSSLPTKFGIRTAPHMATAPSIRALRIPPPGSFSR